jgi:hypothetical protein
MAAFLVDVTMGRIERAPGLERTGTVLARQGGSLGATGPGVR